MAEIIKIDNNTWRFEDVYVRFFLLEGDEKAVLIDSGMNSADAAKLARELTDKPLMLLNTHGDRDHVSGTGDFSEIYMHEADYVGCRIAESFPNVKLVAIDTGTAIDLGGRLLKIIHIPGHTNGSVAILDVDKRVLYAGDTVQKDHIYMFGEHRIPELYEESLDILIAMQDEYDYIYASHDEPILPRDYARKVKREWNKVLAGSEPYEITELHGCRVRSYTLETCGFYMSDIKD